jgi:hypothetical protein
MRKLCWVLLLLVALVLAYALTSGESLDATEPGGMCELHGRPLVEDVLRIEYGLIKPSAEWREARQEQFPHARSRYLGGCVEKPVTRARVSYCPECRRAEANWRATHPRQR